MTVARSSSDGSAIRYVLPVLWMTSFFLVIEWIDNINTWTGLSVEELIRMTEDRYKWRKYAHGLAS